MIAIPINKRDKTIIKKSLLIPLGALCGEDLYRFIIYNEINTNERITTNSRITTRLENSIFTATLTTSYMYTKGRSTAGISKNSIRFILDTFYPLNQKYMIFTHIYDSLNQKKSYKKK